MTPKIKLPMRAARYKDGMTAIDLAMATGIPEARIYHLERQRYRPKRHEAEAIAEALNQPVERLFPAGVQRQEQT